MRNKVISEIDINKRKAGSRIRTELKVVVPVLCTVHQKAPDFSHQTPGTQVTTSARQKEPGEVVIYFDVL